MEELETKGWGHHFIAPETERAYALWRVEKAVPFTRLGMGISAVNWVAVLPMLWLLGTKSVALFTALTVALLVLIAVVLFATWRPQLWKGLDLATALANSLAGLLVIAVLKSQGLPDANWGFGVAVVAQFGFTIFRLTPPYATLSVASYVVPACFVTIASGEVWVTFGLIVTYQSGLFANLVMNRISRQTFRQERIIEAQNQRIELERARADDLLHSILPVAIADRLKQAPQTISDHYDEVTVIFADVVGFTPLAAKVTPAELVQILNDIFTLFDGLAAQHGVEKIKTIGDAYMAVAGLPERKPDTAFSAAAMALAMRAALATNPHGIKVRIGLCTGPVVAGVIGARKFAYDLWGDTVNTAARMEAHGLPDEIQVSESTYERLKTRYGLTDRGTIEVKGKGPMRTWLLQGPRLDSAPPTA